MGGRNQQSAERHRIAGSAKRSDRNHTQQSRYHRSSSHTSTPVAPNSASRNHKCEPINPLCQHITPRRQNFPGNEWEGGQPTAQNFPGENVKGGAPLALD
jgi:hypothetical protein